MAYFLPLQLIITPWVDSFEKDCITTVMSTSYFDRKRGGVGEDCMTNNNVHAEGDTHANAYG